MQNQNLQVKLVESPDTHPTGQVLGITIERFEVIKNVMYDAIKSSSTPLEAVSKMIEHCLHANELAFMCMSTQAYFDREENPLITLFERLTLKQF